MPLAKIEDTWLPSAVSSVMPTRGLSGTCSAKPLTAVTTTASATAITGYPSDAADQQ